MADCCCCPCVVAAILVLCFLARLWLNRKRKDLKGQNVLITGGAAGIGLEQARQFAKRGCSLVLWDISEAALAQAKTELQKISGVGNVTTQRVDVTDAAQVWEALGADIDVLVNNAGIVTGAAVLDTDPRSARRCFEVNVLAHYNTVQAILPGMIDRGRGHIVTISSVMAYAYAANLADYCASKAAVMQFHRCLRMELAALAVTGCEPNAAKIRTTSVHPYAISTGMFDGAQFSFQWLFPVLKPDWVGAQIVDAVEREQLQVFLPGRMKPILLLTEFLPAAVQDAIGQMLGAGSAMNTFTGHKKTN